MMFKNHFVCVVKSPNGKILREKEYNGEESTVFVPFGSEYSLEMKNLDSRRCVVSVSIDGDDVLRGKRLIVDGNSKINLERFLDQLDKGNRFKFIQKTAQISEHRGDRIEDGIIRVEFQYERPIQNLYGNSGYVVNKGCFGGSLGGASQSGGALRSMSLNANVGAAVGAAAGNDAVKASANAINNCCAPASDEGITAKGSVSNQQFSHGYIGALEPEKHVICLKLRGVTADNLVVATPLTVDTKLTCDKCGTTHKSSVNYCPDCGNALAIAIGQ